MLNLHVFQLVLSLFNILFFILVPNLEPLILRSMELEVLTFFFSPLDFKLQYVCSHRLSGELHIFGNQFSYMSPQPQASNTVWPLLMWHISQQNLFKQHSTTLWDWLIYVVLMASGLQQYFLCLTNSYSLREESQNRKRRWVTSVKVKESWRR